MQYEELKDKLNKVKEPKRSFLIPLVDDLIRLRSKQAEISEVPEFIINPEEPTQQVVLPIHKVKHDLQAQINDITTKILRSLDSEVAEESPLLKVLAPFINE